MKLLRRFVTFLVVVAYVGAMSVTPMAYAGTPDMSHSAVHQQDDQGGTMPCKGMAHGCYTELGCVFLVSIPAPDVSLFATTTWLSVAYSDTSETLSGRTIAPALGPPISLA